MDPMLLSRGRYVNMRFTRQTVLSLVSSHLVFQPFLPKQLMEVTFVVLILMLAQIPVGLKEIKPL